MERWKDKSLSREERLADYIARSNEASNEALIRERMRQFLGARPRLVTSQPKPQRRLPEQPIAPKPAPEPQPDPKTPAEEAWSLSEHKWRKQLYRTRKARKKNRHRCVALAQHGSTLQEKSLPPTGEIEKILQTNFKATSATSLALDGSFRKRACHNLYDLCTGARKQRRYYRTPVLEELDFNS